MRHAIARQQRVNTLAKSAAGFRAKASRVHADLIGQACNAEPRPLAGNADRVHALEQLQRAVFGSVCRGDTRGSSITKEDSFRQAAAFENIEPVSEQCGRVESAIPFPDRSGEQRGQHAGERIPAAKMRIGARQCGPQQALCQQNLPFPQIRKRRDELTPACNIAEGVAEVASEIDPRRLLLVQPGLRGIALENRSECFAVRVHI